MFVFGAEGLRFKSRAIQIGHRVVEIKIGHRVVESSLPLHCPAAMTRRWASQTRYALWRYSASIMKYLMFDLGIEMPPKVFNFFAHLLIVFANINATVISLLVLAL